MATDIAVTTTSSSQQPLPTIKEVIDELKGKVEQIDKDLKDQGKMRKSRIYREYADLIANYIPTEMVCDEICKHFPKDERIIRYALDDKYKVSSKVRTKTTTMREPGEIPTSKKNVIDECGKFSAIDGENVIEEQKKKSKPFDLEIEKDWKVLEQMKDENAELKDRVDHLQQKITQMQIRIVTVTPKYCKKIYDIDTQRKENAQVCLIIDGSELLEVIDHYPKNEELKAMIMMEPSSW